MRRILLFIAVIIMGIFSCNSATIQLNRYLLWEDYIDKVKGAWLGQMIGLTAGEHLRLRWQSETIPFDVDHYIRIRAAILKKMNRTLKKTGGRNWTKLQHQYIDNHENWEIYNPESIPDEDDLFLELIYLDIFKQFSPDSLTVQHFVEYWLQYIDQSYLWHANRTAFSNFNKGIFPPESGLLKNNSHGEDLDFQVSADLFGLICPGLPLVSSNWSSQVGTLMCSGDGILGGSFIAGMYTAAFFENSIDSLVEWGLRCIPPETDYARAIRDVLILSKKYNDWKTVWQIITDQWGQNDKCPQGKNLPLNMDAVLNGAYVVIGLIYGEKDFDKTLNIVIRCGQNCDSNAANALGILGCMIGGSKIPAKWKQPLKKSFNYFSIKNLYQNEIEINHVVAKTVVAGIKMITANGGKFINRFGRKWVVVPFQQPPY